MDTLAQIYEANPKLLLATTYKMIELLNPVSEVTGIAWWKELTKRGGEGMVVKPLDFIVRGTRGLIQPAVKCRGPEYLRIIYGPEYDSPENLRRLRSRHPWGERVGGAYQFRVGSNSWEQKCLRSARLKRRSQIPRRR
jgi:protein phosphatase